LSPLLRRYSGQDFTRRTIHCAVSTIFGEEIISSPFVKGEPRRILTQGRKKNLPLIPLFQRGTKEIAKSNFLKGKKTSSPFIRN
jgi:hypothetical protein